MILIVVCLLGGEQEDLGVDVLEHLFQLVLVSHADHAFEAAGNRGVDHLAERIAMLRCIDHESVDIADLMAVPEREQRQMGAAPEVVVPAPVRAGRPLVPNDVQNWS